MLAVINQVERHLLYSPVKYPRGFWDPNDLDYEDVFFNSIDGTSLHGWYMPHPEPRAVVLFAHGISGNISYWQDDFRAMTQELGLSVFAFDYRGYGRSENEPSEQGILEDAEAARNWLCERTGLAKEELILMGQSLGGAAAIHLAYTGGARGLVLDRTFNNLPDVVSSMYPSWPLKWIMRTTFRSDAKIAHYPGPVLQCHGDADTVVPYRFARRLYNVIRGPKRFVRVDNGRHNGEASPSFWKALDQFIEQVAPQPFVATK